MGKIQKQDVKTEAELISAGATISSAIGTDQLYDITNSQKLSDSISGGAPMTTTGDIVYRNAGVATRLGIGSTGQVLTVAGGVPSWAASGGGGGGGSTSNTYTLSGILTEILSDEADIFTPSANQLVDDFDDEEKGTKVTVAKSASALRFTSSNLTGTYERVKMITKTMGTVDGGAVVSAQALAPKATALSPSSTSTSVTFKFDGDVTNMFANTKKVVVVRKVISGDTGYDGKVGYSAALSAAGNVAELAISGAPTFSGGETTLVVANPDAIDLDFDLSAASFPTKLRVIPWDYTYQVKSATASSYETMSIKDLNALDTVRIPGENFFAELGSITGSIIKQDGAFSANKTYGVVRVWEKAASNIWHWFSTVNSGASWVKFTTTKNSNHGESEELVGQFLRANPSQIFVADNGKMFSLYYTLSAQVKIDAVYADLTSTQTTLSDTPATGSDSMNDNSITGRVFANGTFNFESYGVAGDSADGSYIAVEGTRGDNNAGVRWYTAGGATHLGFYWTVSQTAAVSGGSIFVNGSGSSHRTTLIRRSNSDGKFYQTYWDQGSTTPVGDAVIGTTATNMLSGSLQSGRSVLFSTSGDTGAFPLLLNTGSNIGFGLTPSWASEKTIIPSGAGLSSDMYCGWNTSDRTTLVKTLRSKLAQNPSDEKHCVMTHDLVHPDGNSRSTLIEIPDVTSFNGIGISQFSSNSTYQLRHVSSSQKTAQTFLATASTPKLRTGSFLIYQQGNIASGSSITASLYATTAGVPSGSALATSTNSYDPSLITKSTSGQWINFNFSNVTLTNATIYALSIEGTQTIDATNRLQLKTSTTNPYVSGTLYEYNGSTWSGPGDDAVFMISDAYITDFGKCVQAGANRASYGFEDTEAQIQNINSTTAQLTFRRTSTGPGLGVGYQLTGHPYRRVLTWGSSGAQSTLTSAVVAGYAPTNFDENLVFNVASGYDDSKRQNVSTGVLDSNSMLEDRSGMDLVASSYTNITSADLSTDASFQSGFALDFDGSSEYVQYTDRPEFDLNFNKPFCIEAEINVSSLSGTRTILSQLDSGAASGWTLQLTASGQLQMLLFASSAVIANRISTASDFVTSTYYVVRATYDGSGGAIKLYKATSPGGTFTELSYTTTVNFSSGNTASTQSLQVSGYAGATQVFAGKIGYAKFSNGSASFNYTGYKNQAPLVGHQNLGTKILAENKLGENSATSGTNFDNAGIISGDVANAAMVDSNDVLVSFSHSIAGTKGNMLYFKWTGNRVSTRDVSALEAVNIRYTT